MDFLEKDLEQIIYENLTTYEGCGCLMNNGIGINYSQLVFRQPRIGGYGIADIVTFSVANKEIVVYELKKDLICINSLIQAVRYRKGLKRFVKSRGYNPHDFDFQIILIGKKVDTSDWVYLFDDDMENVSIYTYNYTLNGLMFECVHLNNYCLVNENF